MRKMRKNANRTPPPLHRSDTTHTRHPTPDTQSPTTRHRRGHCKSDNNNENANATATMTQTITTTTTTAAATTTSTTKPTRQCCCCCCCCCCCLMLGAGAACAVRLVLYHCCCCCYCCCCCHHCCCCCHCCRCTTLMRCTCALWSQKHVWSGWHRTLLGVARSPGRSASSCCSLRINAAPTISSTSSSDCTILRAPGVPDFCSAWNSSQCVMFLKWRFGTQPQRQNGRTGRHVPLLPTTHGTGILQHTDLIRVRASVICCMVLRLMRSSSAFTRS